MKTIRSLMQICVPGRVPELVLLYMLFFSSLQAQILNKVYKPVQQKAVQTWIANAENLPGHIKAFEENLGQYRNPLDAKTLVRYACESGNAQILFTSKGIIYQLSKLVRNEEAEPEEKGNKQEEEGKKSHLEYQYVSVIWPGANSSPVIDALDKTPFYFGAPDALDHSKSINHIPGFRKLLYRNVYPGISIEFSFHPETGIKYSVIAEPGADASLFRMEFSGQEGLRLDAEGILHMQTTWGDILDHAPVTLNSSGQPVNSSFELLSSNRVHFKIDPAAARKGLVIDPWTVTPVTGGAGFVPAEVGMDGGNAAYILGIDESTRNQWTQKYTSGGALRWSYRYAQFTPGYTPELQSDLAVDPSGNTYVAAPFTYSNANAVQYALVKLDSTGSLVYFYNTNNSSSIYETWNLAYSCNYSTLIQAGCGSYLWGNVSQVAVMTPATGVLGTVTTNNNLGEVYAGCVAPDGKYYCMATDSNAGGGLPSSGAYNNLVAYTISGGVLVQSWQKHLDYTYVDFSLKSGPNVIGSNGIAGGCGYIYTSDGVNLDQRSLVNGALVRRVIIPGGSNATSAAVGTAGAGYVNSGITVDMACGYVYVGSANQVVCYDANLNLVHTYTGLPGIVFDVTFNNGLISCTGATTANVGFVARLAAQTCGSQVNITHTNASCTAANGTATATATFCSGPYSYVWSPSGQTTQTATGLTAGFYTVHISTANSCVTISDTVTIFASSGLAYTQSGVSNASCNGGCNGTATITPSGTAPYTYSWSPSGGSSATASSLCAGTYTCTIKDANGCTSSPTVTITQPSALSVTPSQTNVTCNSANTGTATATAGGGSPAYTYTWNPAPGGGQGTNTATGLSGGTTYTCTIHDANNCSITQTFTITQPTALSITPTQTNVSCHGANSGTATVAAGGGSPAYTYTWSPAPGGGQGTNTATGLSGGTTYTCTIHDANNCSTSQTFTITQPSALSVTPTQTNVSCNGAGNGTATVSAGGGSPAYTYTWSPAPGGGQGTNTATGLTGGTTYTCTIHDANNCSTSQTFTITQPTVLTITPSQTNVNCNGANSGTATATAGGGSPAYTYTWSPAPGGGQGTNTATSLSGGTTYTCTIHDANNCSTSQTFMITQPTALSITPTQTNVTCNGANTGSAVATAGGGSPAYTYTWSPAPGGGQGTNTATSLSGGTTYTCTIHD
ncbi:MAG TPA: SprB repeat-containing protein, partial [Bacteroidia bacterium]|nr:SprB repeat-containing protein [Bacteroidia bacterium]